MKNKKINITDKELSFCRFYVLCGNTREAAAKAGYLLAERTGIKLLEKPEIRNQIKCFKRTNIRNQAIDGFWRLAFGNVSDAISLALGSSPSAQDVEKLDLFAVQEIKVSKGGGVEVKFYDRFKSLEKLSELSQVDVTDNSFFDALRKGAGEIFNKSGESNEI